jgi:hypothetical protein
MAGINYIIDTPEGRETGRKEVNDMVQLRVTQVTFLDNGEMLVAGVPVNDATKVVIARAPEEVAYGIAMALASGVTTIATPPDEDIVEVREP